MFNLQEIWAIAPTAPAKNINISFHFFSGWLLYCQHVAQKTRIILNMCTQRTAILWKCGRKSSTAFRTTFSHRTANCKVEEGIHNFSNVWKMMHWPTGPTNKGDKMVWFFHLFCTAKKKGLHDFSANFFLFSVLRETRKLSPTLGGPKRCILSMARKVQKAPFSSHDPGRKLVGSNPPNERIYWTNVSTTEDANKT